MICDITLVLLDLYGKKKDLKNVKMRKMFLNFSGLRALDSYKPVSNKKREFKDSKW